MMFFLSIFLWVMAIFTYANKNKKTSDQWFAYTLILYGIAGFSVILREQADLGNISWVYSAVAAAVGMLWAPFCFFVAALHYVKLMPKEKNKAFRVTLLCAVPAALYCTVFPVLDCFITIEPRELSDYYARMKVLFMAPYYLGGMGLITWNVFRKSEFARMKENISTFFITVPTGLAYYSFGYILPAYGKVDAWKASSAVIFLMVLTFFYFVIRGNALGLSYQPHNASRQKMESLVIEGTGTFQTLLAADLERIETSLNHALHEIQSDSKGIKDAIVHVEDATKACEDSQLQLRKIYNKMNPIFPRKQRTPIVSIVESAIIGGQDKLRDRLPEKKVTINTNFEADPHVMCDADLMTEVIQNVLENSIEAMQNSVTGILEIKVTQVNRKVLLLIKDNGCGININESKRIGIPLLTTKDGSAHHGLGLYYIKKVVEMHDGHFNMKNSVGGGVTVEIILPVHAISLQNKEL